MMVCWLNNSTSLRRPRPLRCIASTQKENGESRDGSFGTRVFGSFMGTDLDPQYDLILPLASQDDSHVGRMRQSCQSYSSVTTRKVQVRGREVEVPQEGLYTVRSPQLL